MNILCLDFGGTQTKYGVMDEYGNLQQNGAIRSPVANLGQYIRVVRELCDAHRGRVEGLAVSMPGMFDSRTGYMTSGGSYTFLRGQNIYDVYQAITRLPVVVENDGKCAVLAEHWNGGLQDCQNGVVVMIGTGIAGGILSEGRVLRGANGFAGELSYLFCMPGIYEKTNLLAIRGGMVGLISRVAVRKGYPIEALENPEIASKFMDLSDMRHETTDERIDGQTVFRLVAEGDPIALEEYRTFLTSLAQMLHSLTIILNPEKILIGGGVSRNSMLLRDLQAEMDRLHAAYPRAPRSELDICAHRNESNLYGAAYSYLLWKGKKAG